MMTVMYMWIIYIILCLFNIFLIDVNTVYVMFTLVLVVK